MDDRTISQMLVPDEVDVPDVDDIRARGRSIRRRRRLGVVAGGALAVVIAVLVAPALLGGSIMSVDIGPAGPDRQPPPGNEPLAEALLTVEDLPDGWQAAGIDQPTARPSEGAIDICGNDTTPDTPPIAQASANFGKDTFLNQTLMAYEVADAVDEMQKVAAAADSCSTWEQASNGQPMSWQLEHLDTPDLGDESVAIRIAGRSQGTFIWNYEWTIWRDGPVIGVLARWGMGNQLGDPSPLPDIARTAADKLRRTLTHR